MDISICQHTQHLFYVYLVYFILCWTVLLGFTNSSFVCMFVREAQWYHIHIDNPGHGLLKTHQLEEEPRLELPPLVD